MRRAPWVTCVSPIQTRRRAKEPTTCLERAGLKFVKVVAFDTCIALLTCRLEGAGKSDADMAGQLAAGSHDRRRPTRFSPVQMASVVRTDNLNEETQTLALVGKRRVEAVTAWLKWSIMLCCSGPSVTHESNATCQRRQASVSQHVHFKYLKAAKCHPLERGATYWLLIPTALKCNIFTAKGMSGVLHYGWHPPPIPNAK
ncbi:hypothetical protein GE21DRAFT_1350949 [Neurospora crassa]|nr:hypothetical protein B24P7.80 [imported] - Neurospora crassa [Neurospora crassa]KHE89229.1 hypothetical protein GE21DRAFT_1350949 [Neurospora crassa]